MACYSLDLMKIGSPGMVAIPPSISTKGMGRMGMQWEPILGGSDRQRSGRDGSGCALLRVRSEKIACRHVSTGSALSKLPVESVK
jgi:hypothetical protein